MSKVTPQEYAEKWARRTRGATQDYVTGVSRVTQAPGAKAAQAKQLWAARIAESWTSGRARWGAFRWQTGNRRQPNSARRALGRGLTRPSRRCRRLHSSCFPPLTRRRRKLLPCQRPRWRTGLPAPPLSSARWRNSRNAKTPAVRGE